MGLPFTLHFVYLHAAASDPQWYSLHRFLHPGSLAEGQCVMIAVELDTSHGYFLRLRARDWTEKAGSKSLLLPYGLVASALEIRSHTNQVGFVRPEEIREQAEAPKE
jgi:hypothetical protein